VAVDQQFNGSSPNAQSGVAINGALSNLPIFINTSRRIQQFYDVATINWTATENCFVAGRLYATSNGGLQQLRINNEIVGQCFNTISSGGNVSECSNFYMKKGQVLTLNTTGTGLAIVDVYGLY